MLNDLFMIICDEKYGRSVNNLVLKRAFSLRGKGKKVNGGVKGGISGRL